jgi:hypothetical protein
MTTNISRRALIGGAGLAAVASGLAITSQAKGAVFPTVDRAAWDQAFEAMTIAVTEDDANAAGFDALYDGADEDTQTALHAEFVRIGDVRFDATWALFAIPAPDRAALLWKTEYLFGETPQEHGSCPSWSSEVMNWYMADQRRLLGPEAH